MNDKVLVANANLSDALGIMSVFPGTSVGIPAPRGGLDSSELAKKGICGIYASARRAKELQPQLRK